MKKILLLFVIAFAVSEMANAQHAAGDKNLNLGVGLGNQLAAGSGIIPPVSASFEVGIKDNISVGGYLGFTASEFDWGGAEPWKYRYTIIGARGSYHVDLLGNEKIDTYGGVMLGYYIFSADWGNSGIKGTGASSAFFSAFVGGRYAFSQ